MAGAVLATLSSTQPSNGNDIYTKLLLHCNGAAASTSFLDSSWTTKTVTANGDAQVSTAQSVFGGGSLLLDGTGDYLSTPDHTDFEFGSGDFTIDLRVRFNSIATSQILVAKWVTSGNQRAWRLMWSQAATQLQIGLSSDGAAATNVAQTWSPSTGVWYHVEVVRSGGNVYHFVDGSLLGSATANSTNIFNGTAGVEVGSQDTGTVLPFNGWMDEIRISKGIGRHTAGFTPPATAYY